LSVSAYAIATTSFLEVLPGVDSSLQFMISTSCELLGHWLLFAGVLAYARHVVLDAEGVIEHSHSTNSPVEESGNTNETSRSKSESSESTRRSSPATLRIADSSSGASRTSTVAEKANTRVDEWVDGSRRERDRYESEEEEEEGDDGRKFNKTERKQMRKLKARNRAA
jgi:hypothetical protein